MPTGYTAGIIEGSITDFKTFAKRCARAFWAMIMMRDEPLDKEWEPRKPDDYYQNNIEKNRQLLFTISKLSDTELITYEVNRINSEITRMEKAILEKQTNELILEDFLEQSESYVAPTAEHEGIRSFMIEQIKTTIEHDTDCSYYEEAIDELLGRLKKLDAKGLREEYKKHIEKEIEYWTEEEQKEIERCRKSNEWVETFFKSLEAN